jgi:CheY-like chemotaxis protein/nitrogen-specific signal transduction histidine kinase
MDGVVVGIMAFAYDVTDQVLARNEAERLRARAEDASRLKDEFLATISHELRTPLSSILGWATLLRQHGVESSALERGLSVIERNARAQLRIVEDILDIARIVRGEMRLKTQTVDAATIAREVIESVKPSADAKGVSVVVSTPTGGCKLVADPDRLRQVLWNLLANAVKFTPEGGEVHLDVTPDAGKIVIVITDTGRGMDASFVPHAFDPFRQAEAPTTRAAGGLGLGLAIVRHIVEAHGGSVRAQSPGVGKGSTFRVELPVASVARREDDARFAKQGDATAERPLEGVRVLVVEDDRDGRELVELTLSREGATVACAASAAEALDAVPHFSPAVIVSDIGMPERDGYWLASQLRRELPDVPLVALTAFGRTEDVARARAAGFDVHLAKPVEPRELIMTLASLASRS